ncbi:hypothetical protein D7X74_03245 [Corallococcus sp. CA047B]|nr:hypothetical protein D7X74_03245 [Corallococcus sp. CA047B]
MTLSTYGNARSVLSSVLSQHDTCVWVLVLGLTLLPLGARGDVSPDVHRCVVFVHQLFEDLEYERALEQVVHGRSLSKGPEDQVVLSLYEGVILAELSGRLSGAEVAFKDALFLNPDAKLPMTVSPKVERHFEAVRQGVLSELAARGDREPLRLELPSGTPPDQPILAVVPGLPESSSSPVSEVSGSHASLRDRAIIPAVTGGALVAAAGVVWGLAEGKKSRLADMASDIPTGADARNVANSARRMQTVSVGMLVGGLVGLGTATGMYLLGGEPKEPAPLRFGLDGTSVFVSGRWP